jgi:predicted O-methyltransferase YrrM
MTTDSSPPQPTTIQKLSTAVYPSFAMLAGMQLDLFTPLQQGPMTAQQLAGSLGVKAEKLSPLLYALVTAELLTVDGERFANTAEADQFLVQGKPTYMGSLHEILLDMWQAILHTTTTVRSGIPQARHDFAAMSPEELAAFFRGLHPAALAEGRMLVARCDLSAVHTLVDVGGGSGGLALAVTEACPHLCATVVDLPSVTPITQRFIADAGATDRVQVLTADVINEILPGSWDMAVLRAFLPVLAPAQARQALSNLSTVMASGGLIYITDWGMLDDSRLSPPVVVGTNLFFLNVFDEGQAYTEHEVRSWLTEVGFVDVVCVRQPNGAGIVTARKPE